MIEKPLWMFGKATVLMWHWARKIWQGVMKFLHREAVSLTIICLYAVALAIFISIWPVTKNWLRLSRTVDIALVAVSFLWGLMLLVWAHEKVQEQMLRWVPALLAAPAWFPFFIPLFALLLLITLLIFGATVLLTPLGALAMLLGLFFAWWRRRHGITLRCKYGDCHSQNRKFRDVEVRYRCPGNCGTSYGYMIPSHYGLLFHNCTCGSKIPALKSLRQKKDKKGQILENTLIKECPGPSRHPWSSATDPLPSHYIAVAGGTTSGKTHYLTMALKDLLALSAGSGATYQASFDDKKDLEKHRESLERLDQGIPLGRTLRGEAPIAFVLRLKDKAGKDERLYLYDAAGEKYTSLGEETVKDFVFFEDLTGIILMVDPLGLPKLKSRVRSKAPQIWEALMVSNLPFEYVVAGLRKNIARYLKLGTSGRTNIPLAVVINKVDAPLAAERIGAEAKKDAENLGKSEHDLCREALIEWGAGNDVQILEADFPRLRYFSCSALGRIPDQSGQPFRAEQVLPALLWLLQSESASKRKH